MRFYLYNGDSVKLIGKTLSTGFGKGIKSSHLTVVIEHKTFQACIQALFGKYNFTEILLREHSGIFSAIKLIQYIVDISSKLIRNFNRRLQLSSLAIIGNTQTVLKTLMNFITLRELFLV